MPRRLMIVEYDDDEELSKSRKSPGKQSPLTRDQDGNLSQVVLDEPSDEDLAAFSTTEPPPDGYPSDEGFDDGRLTQQDVENLIALLTAMVEVVGPRVRDWWRDSGRDSVRAARARMVARVRRRRPDEPADVELVGPNLEADGDVSDPDGPTITVDEARRILHDALAAAAYAQHQIGLLQRAAIVDDGTSQELANALRQLGSGNVSDMVAMLNQADPVALNEMLLATRPVSLRALRPAPAVRQDDPAD